MRVATYLSCAPGEGGKILESQLSEMQRLIRAQKGWRLVKMYSDLFTAALEERPAFRQMLKDAEKHRFDVLLFWTLDRLSQQGPLHSLRLLHRLHGWGIQYRSVSEPHLDSCGLFREAVTSVVAILAAQERNHLVRRTRMGLMRQRKNHSPGPEGRLGPGRPPLAIDLKELQALRTEDPRRERMAAALGISKSTLDRRLKKIVNE